MVWIDSVSGSSAARRAQQSLAGFGLEAGKASRLIAAHRQESLHRRDHDGRLIMHYASQHLIPVTLGTRRKSNPQHPSSRIVTRAEDDDFFDKANRGPL